MSIIPGPLSKKDDTFPERIQGFSIEREELTSELMKDIIEEATERIFGNEPAKHINGHKPAKKVTLSDALSNCQSSRVDTAKQWAKPAG